VQDVSVKTGFSSVPDSKRLVFAGGFIGEGNLARRRLARALRPPPSPAPTWPRPGRRSYAERVTKDSVLRP
jgi:hypothetical protein